VIVDRSIEACRCEIRYSRDGWPGMFTIVFVGVYKETTLKVGSRSNPAVAVGASPLSIRVAGPPPVPSSSLLVGSHTVSRAYVPSSQVQGRTPLGSRHIRRPNMRRIKVCTEPPLPPLRAWYPIKDTVETVYQLKYSLTHDLAILVQSGHRRSDIGLEIDGFDLLDGSSVDILNLETDVLK
jgi:hypothetical protein